MLKRLIQISSLATLLAITAIFPAAASASEEDAAAPAGSFTSDMAIPMRPGHDHVFHFRHHARIERHWHFG